MKIKILLIAAMMFGVSSAVHSQCTDLFISEYIEGSSFNKAVEIYNPTSSSIDLTDYKLQLFSANSTTVSQEVQLTGTLNAGDVYVVCHASADAAITGIADLQSSAVINYNGDDAIALAYDPTGSSATVIDAIGSMDGVDPGTSWTVGSGATKEFTLVRKVAINSGQLNWVSGAGEWDDYPQNTFTYLGSHTMTPCSAPSNPEVQFSTGAMNVDEDGTSITVTVNIVGEDANPTSIDLVLLGTGTATEGTDFTYAATATATFPANDNTAQTVIIPIIDNALVDGDLTFELELQNATNSATVGTNSNLVVIIVDDEAVIPTYTIDQVDNLDANGEADSVGVECKISGFVLGVNLRTTGMLFTINDGTEGIAVVNFTTDLGYTVNEGDSIDVTGTIDQYNGLLQIEVTELNVHTSTTPMPTPTVVTTVDELTESELIRINNCTIVNLGDWDGMGTGFNADITDGTSTYTLRIDAEVDLFSMLAPDGTFDVIGIGSQFDFNSPFDEGYQIMPRYNDDILIKPTILNGDQTVCPGDSISVDYQNVTYDWYGTNEMTNAHVVDTAGTYTVEVTYGTVSVSVSAVLTLSTDLPEAGFTVSDDNPCINHTIVVTDTSINANSIDVYFGDGNSATSSPASNMYAVDGTYTVTLVATSAFGCIDSADLQLTIDPCLGVEENTVFDVNVYPNPSNGYFQLTTVANGVYNIQVLDITGQVLQNVSTSENVFEMNLSNLPSGIYFLKLTNDKLHTTKKIVLK
jgi:hypothetical protein